MLITQSEAAIRYEVTRQNISKRVRLGTIPTDIDENGRRMIDTDRVDPLFGVTDAPPPVRVKPHRPPAARRAVSNKPKPPVQDKPPQAETLSRRQAKEQVRSYVKALEVVPELAESRARVEFLKAELLEMDRREKEGALVRADEVQRKWTEVAGIVRTKVLAVPSKAKQRIPDLPQGAVGILEDIVREALEEIADADD